MIGFRSNTGLLATVAAAALASVGLISQAHAAMAGSASPLALACYCCDRVLAAQARFHDPPLPRLLVADQLRRPPRSFVPVSAHGQGFLRYLPPSKRLSVPAPAASSRVRLPGRRDLRS